MEVGGHGINDTVPAVLPPDHSQGTGGLQYSGDDLIVLQDYFFRAADGTPVDTIEYGKFMGTLAIRSV